MTGYVDRRGCKRTHLAPHPLAVFEISMDMVKDEAQRVVAVLVVTHLGELVELLQDVPLVVDVVSGRFSGRLL